MERSLFRWNGLSSSNLGTTVRPTTLTAIVTERLKPQSPECPLVTP